MSDRTSRRIKLLIVFIRAAGAAAAYNIFGPGIACGENSSMLIVWIPWAVTILVLSGIFNSVLLIILIKKQNKLLIKFSAAGTVVTLVLNILLAYLKLLSLVNQGAVLFQF